MKLWPHYRVELLILLSVHGGKLDSTHQHCCIKNIIYVLGWSLNYQNEVRQGKLWSTCLESLPLIFIFLHFTTSLKSSSMKDLPFISTCLAYWYLPQQLHNNRPEDHLTYSKHPELRFSRLMTSLLGSGINIDLVVLLFSFLNIFITCLSWLLDSLLMHDFQRTK